MGCSSDAELRHGLPTGSVASLGFMSGENQDETPLPRPVTQRVWSLRTIAAAAITAVAVAGTGGAALASVSDGTET